MLENFDKEKDEFEDSSLLLLKFELEEAKNIEGTLMQWMKEKGKECEKIEDGVISLRKELERTKALLNYNLKL